MSFVLFYLCSERQSTKLLRDASQTPLRLAWHVFGAAFAAQEHAQFDQRMGLLWTRAIIRWPPDELSCEWQRDYAHMDLWALAVSFYPWGGG